MNTGQVRAGIVSGGGKNNLLDLFLEIFDVERDSFVQVGSGHGWKLFGADTFDVGVQRAAFYIKGLGMFVYCEDNIFIRQVADHVHKGAGGNGKPTFLFNFSANPGADA